MKNFDKTHQLTAAIIAGGESRRFGTPKIFAKFGDKMLIEHALALATRVSPSVIVSTGKHHILGDFDCRCIPDIFPDCGPLGGIHSVLQHSETPWVAILPCDVPLLPASVYEILYHHKKEGCPVVAESQNGMEPLISIWPKSLVSTLETSLKKEEFAIFKLIETLNPVKISMPENLPNYYPEMFFNINRKEDLERLKKFSGVQT